ncbi:hypothetical protein [Leptospira levettii]|uniref:hypothetical protein n=1 Tax=Leptospira levettii TaxID=2023178 RepID=UPI0013FDA8F3|nr:hypothetical protein [Leptospira levettii]
MSKTKKNQESNDDDNLNNDYAPTLAESIAAEQMRLHLSGKEVKNYPKVLEDL